jgi:hypothetical protein
LSWLSIPRLHREFRAGGIASNTVPNEGPTAVTLAFLTMSDMKEKERKKKEKEKAVHS